MSDPVTRLNAALEGRYAIERELGEGGMATVYLADDLKHERKVALKVLKPELAAVVGAERFLAEIKTTANLTHPNILPLFDSGEADTFLYYVMPYIEGESLRDRLDREHQLPVDEAVKITTDLAEALDYAHRNEVIHRDIKPANIMLHEGRPLIADFGIALAVGAAGGGRLTETGLSLGTPFYMSPEQATGDQFVGAATDTYALGSVLYEMLTGDPPYMGSTAQAVLGQIISSRAISATEKRASIPANVDAALRKALEKLPADRFKSSQEFAKALGDQHFRYGEAVAGIAGTTVGPWNTLTMVTTVLASILAVSLAWVLLRPEPSAPNSINRFSVTSSDAEQGILPRGRGVALSPDGSLLVYTGFDRLWQRPLDQLEIASVPGSEGPAQSPAFSPDGASVAYLAQGDIRIVSLEGGLESSTAVAPFWASHLDWSADGMLYFQRTESLWRLPAAGGQPEQVTTPEPGTTHGRPHVLPRGRGLLFTISTSVSSEPSRVAALDFEDGEMRILFPGINPYYSMSGHIVFVAGDNLMGVPFDLGPLEVTGESVELIQNVSGSFTLSETGTLAYVPRGNTDLSPVWYDRAGQAIPLPMDPSAYSAPRVSPEGNRLLVGDALELRVIDLNTGTRTQIGGVDSGEGVWTPDGSRIVYRLWDGTTCHPFIQAANGSDAPQAVGDGELEGCPTSVSIDGVLLLDSSGEQGRADLIAVSLDDNRITRLTDTPDEERGGMFSPDGRFIAYSSDESGVWEVYVQPYPGFDARMIVSAGGGRLPMWSWDGTELFYVQDDRRLMAVKVTTVRTFGAGRPEMLFEGDGRLFFSPSGDQSYDVSADGRFLMLELESVRDLIVVTNFFEELKRLVPN